MRQIYVQTNITHDQSLVTSTSTLHPPLPCCDTLHDAGILIRLHVPSETSSPAHRRRQR